MNNIDEFYLDGHESYRMGTSLDECPFDEGTDGEYGWKKGWRQAEKEAKEAEAKEAANNALETLVDRVELEIKYRSLILFILLKRTIKKAKYIRKITD